MISCRCHSKDSEVDYCGLPRAMSMFFREMRAVRQEMLERRNDGESGERGAKWLDFAGDEDLLRRSCGRPVT